MKLLYIGVCRENLEKYYPSYIKGEFLKDTFTDAELADAVTLKNIDVLMVDVFNIQPINTHSKRPPMIRP